MYVDVNVAFVDSYGIDRDRLGGGQVDRLAGAQVEHRPVQPALDLVAVDLTFGQRDRRMRALVLDRVDLVAVADQGDSDAVHFGGDGRSVRDVIEGADPFEVTHGRHRCAPVADAGVMPTLRSSSASTAASSSCSIWRTPIRLMMSAKKPCTTRRRASSSGMPRLCR